MKQVAAVVIALLVVAVAGMWWLNRAAHSEQGEMIGFAVGKAESGAQPIHIVVSMGMARGGQGAAGAAAKFDDEWIAGKFTIRDAAGGPPIRLHKAGHSALISEQKAANPEFFVEGSLKPGTKYIFDYRPASDSPDVYRYEFTTVEAGIPFARQVFTRVKS